MFQSIHAACRLIRVGGRKKADRLGIDRPLPLCLVSRSVHEYLFNWYVLMARRMRHNASRARKPMVVPFTHGLLYRLSDTLP